MRKYNKHVEIQTDSNFVTQEEHDRLNAEYRRTQKQVEALGDTIEKKDLELSLGETKIQRINEVYLEAEAKEQMEKVRANAAEREVRDLMEQAKREKRANEVLGQEVIDVNNLKGAIQEKLDNAHRRIRILTVA